MTWHRSPALHMAALGGLAFAVTAFWGVREPRPRVEVAPHRLELMLRDFAADHGRAPSATERGEMLDALIDDEVLYQYALALDMQKNPAAQRRLAKIADFVEANPHHAASEAERAEAAIELGLHHGDLVVRRILVDSARRLIRAVVLLQEPTAESLENYLQANRDEFMRPARCRISQVAVNGFKWPDSERRARALLARIRGQSLSVDAALALGDQAFVPSSLPALTEQALVTKLGADFAAAVIDLPTGEWAGPIASRYGHHLVWVHERSDAYLPPLTEIRDQVAERLRQKLANEWLALRLKQLRAELDVVAARSS